MAKAKCPHIQTKIQNRVRICSDCGEYRGIQDHPWKIIQKARIKFLVRYQYVLQLNELQRVCDFKTKPELEDKELDELKEIYRYAIKALSRRGDKFSEVCPSGGLKKDVNSGAYGVRKKRYYRGNNKKSY